MPCIGAHYTNIGLVGPFNVDKPSELLYDGTKPDSKIVGLSYLIYNPGGEPAGFAGPNDHWHQHNANGGLCFSKNNGVIGAEDMTREQCTALGGDKHELVDIWMLHDWVVPGWECGWGVFVAQQIARSGPVNRGGIVGVVQRARLERQTPAADARGEIVTESLQHLDLRVELRTP